MFPGQIRRLVEHGPLSFSALAHSPGESVEHPEIPLYARVSLSFDTCEGHTEGIEFCCRGLVFGARKHIYLLAPSDSIKADTI